MIFRRIKKTVTWFQQRQKRLERERERQISQIEKMYSDLEAKDIALQEREKKHMQLDTSFILRFWIFWALIAYFSYIIFKTLDAVYLILAAFVISMILDAPITFFSKYMHRWLAIALSYLLVLWSIFLIVFIVLPFVINQIVDVLKLAINKINEFQVLLQNEGLISVIQNHLQFPPRLEGMLIDTLKSEWLLEELQKRLQENISQIISEVTSYATNLWAFAVKLLWWVFTTIAQAMILFVMAIFFSVEKTGVINFISSLWGGRRNHLFVKMHKMYAKLGLWIKWQFLVCVYVGVVIAILFGLFSWIFGIKIPNIGSLAVIAWMLNFIPYIWPLIGIVITGLVTVIAGWWKAAILAVAIYIIVNQSENNVLTPIIMNKTLWVSALLIFICMLLWGLVFGFIGVLLAVPIAVILTMSFDREED